LAASGSRFQNVSEGRPEAAAVELWSSNCQIPWISDLPDRRSSLYRLAQAIRYAVIDFVEQDLCPIARAA